MTATERGQVPDPRAVRVTAMPAMYGLLDSL